MKRIILIIILTFATQLCAFAQNEIAYRLEKSFDRMFYNTNNPVIDLTVINTDNYEKYADTLFCRVTTDNGEPVYKFMQRFSVSPSDSALLSFSFQVPSGFYKVSLEREDSVIAVANMGYEPERIESKPDPDFSFEDYWAGIIQELKATPINAEVTKVKKLKSKLRNIYSVKMESIGGGIIEGYIAVPKKKGVYKTIITCTDKNELASLPDGDSREEYIDFIISPRKGWLHKEYYYRTLCVDVVRAIDYVYGREDVDLKNIFLKGTGRGGAFVIAACALDTRMAGAAVYAPGLSNESATNELKPYDIKNLSGRVKCPVVMGVGLEDDVCTPRENFEIYNPLSSTKQYYIFVQGHNPPALWSEIVDNFFMKYQR